MTGAANGGGPVAPPVPPIDPGNVFVLQQSTPNRLDDDLTVTVTEVDGAPQGAQQTAVGATLAAGDRVLITTWRCGPVTMTVMLTREDAVAVGRRLVKAASSTPPSLILTGPSAAVAQRVLEVVVEVRGCRLPMLWAREDGARLGAALVQAAQSMGGIITAAPGIQP